MHRLGTVIDRRRHVRAGVQCCFTVALGQRRRDSLIGSLVAEHTGDLIVEIDLTRIGSVSRTFPFGSDPVRSAPLRMAAVRTAQTMAAEKINRSRMELPLCIGLSASVAELGPSTSRLTIQNSVYAFWLLGAWTPPNSKKQASETTQAARQRRLRFGRTPPTRSMPHGVAEQVCQLLCRPPLL